MPKQIKTRQATRPAPYSRQATTDTMAAVMPSALGGWPHHQHNMSWSDPIGTQAPTYQFLSPPCMPMPAPQQQQQQQHVSSIPRPSQSAPWTNDEDTRLIDAKSQGLGWNEIQQRYFSKKSANACRKRHERLMQKLRATNWDDARVRRVTNLYTESGARERFWRDIARRVGEDSWEDVEKVCFQQGLKGLRAKTAGHSRASSRASSGHVEYVQTPSTGGEYESKTWDHDDSGFADALAVGSRRSSHGQSQSVSLPVSGAQALIGLEYLGEERQQQLHGPLIHQRRLSQQISMYH